VFANRATLDRELPLAQVLRLAAGLVSSLTCALGLSDAGDATPWATPSAALAV